MRVLLRAAGAAGADARDGEGLTPLAWASFHGHAATITALLSSPAVDVNAASHVTPADDDDDAPASRPSGGLSSLHFASSRGHAAAVAALLACPTIDVNTRCAAGGSALSRACATYEANRCTWTGAGIVPDDLARQAERAAVIAALLEHPMIDVAAGSLPSTHGRDYVLCSCVRAGRADAVAALLDAGTAERANGYPHLYTAAEKGYTGVVAALLAFPATRVNTVFLPSKLTALCAACINGHAETVAALLARADVDVNQLCGRGKGWKKRSALWYAAHHGHAAVVAALLARPGVMINQTHRTKRSTMTAHRAAAAGGHAAVVQLLAAAGAT